MDRRESLKAMLISSMAGAAIISGCDPEKSDVSESAKPEILKSYGRTEKEKEIDKKLLDAQFFSDHEMDTLATLCDLILPATDGSKSASDAGVAPFIEFMAKDIPKHQLPMRGGIMWLDNFALDSFGKEFIVLSNPQQKSLLDQIAFPVKAKNELSQGVSFFSLVRNMTLTGFYTSKIGIEELGYLGNTPNVWDGVPEEVLREHNLSYDPAWLAKCIDQNTRDQIAEWDKDGNLLN